MSSDRNSGSNNQQKTVYTNSNLFSYDRHFSALTYGFANYNGFIKFSPIKSEYVGKEPKKGEHMYDYDSSESYNISAQDASILLESIAHLRENPSSKYVIYTTGTPDFQREFKIFSPNGVKLGNVLYPNYIIKCTKTAKDESPKSVYHIFATGKFTAGKANEEIELHTDFDLFNEFLQYAIENTFSLGWHGAKRNSSPAASGKTRTRVNQQVDEETDGESESGKQTTKDLNSEFEDD